MTDLFMWEYEGKTEFGYKYEARFLTLMDPYLSKWRNEVTNLRPAKVVDADAVVLDKSDAAAAIAQGREMTHDELLARINAWDEDHYQCPPVVREESCSQAKSLALRAVVELHKPIQISNEQLCNACEEWTNEGQKQLFYPCPTIQAIEKELK